MKIGMVALVAMTLLGCLEKGAIQVDAQICEEVLCGGYCAATDGGGQCFGDCLFAFDGACAEEWTFAAACVETRQSVVLCSPEFAAFDACIAAQFQDDADASSGDG